MENDRLDSYQRRDTLLFSGSLIPAESNNEDTSKLIVSLVNRYLTIKIDKSDINISHRLGPSNKKDRPIIVKFFSRLIKNEILSSCITQITENQLKNFYVNEHLTPKRKNIYMQLRHIRKSKPILFKQLFTKDGVIIVKLKDSEKYRITCEKHLKAFLSEYPYLDEIHKNLEASRNNM